MKPGGGILVATDVVADANQIARMLRQEFDCVEATTDPERWIQDFDTVRPAVLVLAYNTLEKAERHYLGLYRRSAIVHTVRHSTLMLCNKDELAQVYALCKKRYFDDYMLFWPMTHDTCRLPMSVHQLMRQMAEGAVASQSGREIAVQARRMIELDAELDRIAERGRQHMESASKSVEQTRQLIQHALDGFSGSLLKDQRPEGNETPDRAILQRSIASLEAEGIAAPMAELVLGLEPLHAWVDRLRNEFVPKFKAATAFNATASRTRPVVLIVDDDAFQNQLLAQILSNEEFTVIAAASGAEALGMLHKREPDLILMDFQLPDLDGVEVTRRLKSVARFAEIPVIMITGQSDKVVVVESLKAGASDFIVKPVNRAVLLEKVRRFLHDRPAPAADDAQPA